MGRLGWDASAVNPIPITWCAAGALAVAVGSFGAGWQVRSWKADSHLAKIERKAEAERARLQTIVETQATSLEQERAHVIDRTREIRTIYRDKVVPAICEPEPAAVSLLEQARAESNARITGEPSDTVRDD